MKILYLPKLEQCIKYLKDEKDKKVKKKNKKDGKLHQLTHDKTKPEYLESGARADTKIRFLQKDRKNFDSVIEELIEETKIENEKYIKYKQDIKVQDLLNIKKIKYTAKELLSKNKPSTLSLDQSVIEFSIAPEPVAVEQSGNLSFNQGVIELSIAPEPIAHEPSN